MYIIFSGIQTKILDYVIILLFIIIIIISLKILIISKYIPIAFKWYICLPGGTIAYLNNSTFQRQQHISF